MTNLCSRRCYGKLLSKIYKEYKNIFYLVNELINDVPQPLVWQLQGGWAISICLQRQILRDSPFMICYLAGNVFNIIKTY